MEPAQLAWGAYLAGNYRLTAFSGDLLRLATASDWRVRMAATDSLIRLEIDVPEDVLTGMVSDRLDEVLIIIARSPGRASDRYNRLIEDLLARKIEDHYWVALNSILLAKPPAGFTAILLRDWTIRLTVTVYEPGPGSGAGSGGSSSVGDGGGFSQPGFPPLSAYYVYQDPKPGDVLLANGPHPVGYRKQTGHCRSGPTIERDEYRRDYLMHLAGIYDSTARSISTQLSTSYVEWKDEAAYRDETRKILVNVRQLVAHLKTRLVERKLLTAEEEGALTPKLEVRILDQRRRRTPRLPEVPWALTETKEAR